MLAFLHLEGLKVGRVDSNRGLQRLLEDLWAQLESCCRLTWVQTFAMDYLLRVASEMHPAVFVKHVQVLGLRSEVLGERSERMSTNSPTAPDGFLVKCHTHRLNRLVRKFVRFFDSYFGVSRVLLARLLAYLDGRSS